MPKRQTLAERADKYADLWDHGRDTEEQGFLLGAVSIAWLEGYRAAQRDARKSARVWGTPGTTTQKKGKA